MLSQQLANGLIIGLIYGLLALGFSLVYSTTRVVNFAHGEIFTAGAFLALACLRGGLTTSLILAGALAVMAVFLVGGLFTYTVLWKLRTPLERSVATIALSLALRDGMLLAFGSDSESFPPSYPEGALTLAGLVVPYSYLVIASATAILLAGFTILVRYSRMGIWMRATAQDEQLAALVGIPTRWIQAFAFGLGAGLAATAGILVAPTWQVNYAAGTTVGLKAFTAALLGGLGNLPGAIIGGVVLGLLEALLAGYVSSTWKDLAVYICLLAVLTVFPGGIFAGRKARVG
jgi:branched-chain amino acid transport system permease protein